MRTDGAVLLAAVRRQYFRVELGTTFDKMDWMASFMTSTASLDVGSCLNAAADSQAHVVIASGLWSTACCNLLVRIWSI